MGSRWKIVSIGTYGQALVVEGLKKPYLPNALEFSELIAYEVKPIGDGWTVQIRLKHGREITRAIESALWTLDEAGYLNNRQGVTIKKQDTTVVMVTFEHQLPVGINHRTLYDLLQNVDSVAGSRTITIGSTRQLRREVDDAVQGLWKWLFRRGVIPSAQPPKY